MDGVLRGFDNWMIGLRMETLVLSLLAFLLLVPALVLIHELGHALVGLTRTEGLVAVRIGRKPWRWRGRVGRLQLELNPIPARNAPAGSAAVYARYGTATEVLLLVAGPLAEAAAAAIILWLGLRVHASPLQVAGGLGLADAARNLIPLERDGLRSDGAYLLDALRHAKARSPQTVADLSAQAFAATLEDTFARWLVLFSDERSPARSERRAQILGGAPVALGYRPDDRSAEAVALWQLALAGWCWREVERGDPSCAREAALDALHAATLTGAVEPGLTALAARGLATSSIELGAASPGNSDTERTRFLTAALARLPSGLRPTSLPDEQQRFAFRYGVALRDIERIRP